MREKPLKYRSVHLKSVQLAMYNAFLRTPLVFQSCAPCRELSKVLSINVLGYDYSGYGCSTGTPSVSNAIADINACYHYLLHAKGKRPQDIVIYGQSVGSGPTCDIAASEKNVMGIVLHSPLMSGICLKCQSIVLP